MVAQGGGRSPFAVTLTASQRRFFKALVRRQTAQQRQVTRARIVLGAAAGLANAAIARKLGWRPTPWASGASGSAGKALTAWPIASGPAARGCSHQRWSPTPRRWPVSCPGPVGAAVALEPGGAAR
jgi:hypothetical protein